MFVLYVFWGRRSFIDPICRNSCMVLSMFLRLVLANSLFSLRDINLTLGLLPPRRHVVWRDSVGVRSSGSGLKSECADIFSSEPDLWLLRHTDEPQRGRNSCLWLQSRSVLSSFGAVLMSCRVNFHVVRSALQNLICLEFKLHLNGRCSYNCFWITPDLRCQKRLWILCFSKSEQAALSSLSWSVFCVSGFVTLFLKSTASFTLALSLFGLLYTETWQV